MAKDFAAVQQEIRAAVLQVFKENVSHEVRENIGLEVLLPVDDAVRRVWQSISERAEQENEPRETAR